MAVYLLVTAAAVAAAWFVKQPQPLKLHSGMHSTGISRQDALSRILLAVIFTCLVLPEVLRINVGNDYAKYVEFMHLIRSNAYVPTEPGFNLLVRAVYGLCGWENYLLVFGLFSVMTIALFLTAIRQQAEDFGFSFLLFMLLGYYFQTYNTVRYYFALAAVIFALRFLLRKEYVPFVITVLLAAAFHKSVLVVLILYPLALLPWKKWQMAAAGAFLCTFLLFPAWWLKLVVMLYPSYEDTPYLEGNSISWTSVLRCGAVLLLALYCRSRQEEAPEAAYARRFRFYFNCSLGALALYAFCFAIPFVSRIANYLTFLQIFFIPMLLHGLPCGTEKERKRKKVLTALVIFAAAAYFAMFLRKMSGENLRILPYQTYLFSDMPKTLSEVNN
jgi:hypothetical protein